ncbi:MAG TPA: osmoprotectant transporter permease [Candidatus Binatia bacterium]|jgi:Na+/melibiose symporter-like transporter
MTFKILWGIDAVIAAVFVYFFIVGLGDGSVSSFNMRLWLGTLGTLAGVLAGSRMLQRSGRTRLAISLLMILAVPGLAVGLFFLAMIIINPRWN